ncbi:hypothetical protein BC938DRAFT_482402 [Jimgerdemannia flammicorona]|uniref:Uncharacterized protein n=1 Tax=Jimgerdemannia flammicorona TaxID=994334 RepID=A0A433QE69_9FUNG|nr:hypothetical protein BC938DRAFT_482402 [Jimgerdemannia flammicorona]
MEVEYGKVGERMCQLKYRSHPTHPSHPNVHACPSDTGRLATDTKGATRRPRFDGEGMEGVWRVKCLALPRISLPEFLM